MDINQLISDDPDKAAKCAQVISTGWQIVTGIVQIFIVIATAIILYLSVSLNILIHYIAIESKNSDIISEFNTRFSRTWEMRANPDVKSSPEVFYDRFWSQQLDQFSAWQRGWLSEEDYKYWLEGRHRDWELNESLGAMSYRDGYNKTVSKWSYHSKFHDFMNTVHNLGVGAALKKYPPGDVTSVFNITFPARGRWLKVWR